MAWYYLNYTILKIYIKISTAVRNTEDKGKTLSKENREKLDSNLVIRLHYETKNQNLNIDVV